MGLSLSYQKICQKHITMLWYRDFLGDMFITLTLLNSFISVINNSLFAMFQSHLNHKSNKMTALQATIFSRTVSNCQPSEYSDVDQNINAKLTLENENHHTMSLFPYIDNHLCYSCSKSYLESGFENIFEIKES